jgi:hypothetical protein
VSPLSFQPGFISNDLLAHGQLAKNDGVTGEHRIEAERTHRRRAFIQPTLFASADTEITSCPVNPLSPHVFRAKVSFAAQCVGALLALMLVGTENGFLPSRAGAPSRFP